VTTPPTTTDAPVSTPLDLGPPRAWCRAHGLPVGGALLDADGPSSPSSDGVDRYAALCLAPVERLALQADDPDPLGALQALVARSNPAVAALPGPRPFVVCALGYELGAAIEPRMGAALPPAPTPDLWAARYDAVYVWDRLTQRGRVLAEDATTAANLVARLRTPGTVRSEPPLRPVGPIRTTPDEAGHRRAIARALDHIARGDVYQVNLATRFEVDLDRRAGDPTLLFDRLHAQSPVPFAALVRPTAEHAILSVSPERFLRWDPDGHVETRPIKGTRPRGDTEDADAEQAAALHASPKDAAEHVMIVDLERNDLGRICRPGTVRVVRDRVVERFATVHHLVSTVAGRLRPGIGVGELLRATFPGGSITGAPKIRAVELIAALEGAPRGIYCGSLGYLDPAGGGDLNIAIRTAWVAEGRLHFAAGGGIVADSDAGAEWAEAQLKAKALRAALQGAH
jgi:para-aminobenzoate synthetase component 1